MKVLLCIFPFLVGIQLHAAPLHVVIDPGHGGKDQGAVHGSQQEAKITLEVAKKLTALLKNDPRFKSTLTREADNALSLSERSLIAREAKGDLFVSIHVNSSSDSRVKGMEVYFQNQLPPDEESLFLASRENMQENENEAEVDSIDSIEGGHNLSPDVQSLVLDLLRNQRIRESSKISIEIKKQWQGSHRSLANSIRQAPFFVITHVNMPSALVELGYLTNPDDAKRLSEPTQQEKMAQNLFLALVKYKEEVDKASK